MSNFLTPYNDAFNPVRSSGFLGARPADHTFGDYVANDVGRAVAGGISSFLPRSQSASDAKTAFELDLEKKKAAARAQIADMATNVPEFDPPDVEHQRYLHSLQVGIAAGLGQDEIDNLWRSAAVARGRGEDFVGSLGAHQPLGLDFAITGEGRQGLRDTARSQSLADRAADVAEQQRQEGVAADVATTTYNRQVAERKRQEAVAKANEKVEPPLGMNELDDLTNEVNRQLLERMGAPQYDDKGMQTQVPIDAGVATAIRARAAELMAAPNNLDAIRAVNQAIDDVASIDPFKEGGWFGVGGSPGGVHAKPGGEDPLGLFANPGP